MNAKEKAQARSQNEPCEVMTFNYSESQTEIRSLSINQEPWMVAKDICDALGLKDTNMALKGLDEDEKLTQTLVGSGQKRKMWLVSESGMYALILRSNKPEAKSFRKWVTSEVLPTIRKKGYYGNNSHGQKQDYIDARDIPFYTREINGYHVRIIEIDGMLWASVNDVNAAIHAKTGSNQVAKKLNALQTLAKKVWLFGNTHPAWFTNELGVHLMLGGSRKLNGTRQLQLNFGGQA
ncbi:MAG: Bro-N domain-containing protein [Bacteroidales bacterium]|nr:Bro-N domain-containing protein [Bacteroidales bacterium]